MILYKRFSVKLMESAFILFQILKNNITRELEYKMNWIKNNYEKKKTSQSFDLYILFSIRRAGKIFSVLSSIRYDTYSEGNPEK